MSRKSENGKNRGIDSGQQPKNRLPRGLALIICIIALLYSGANSFFGGSGSTPEQPAASQSSSVSQNGSASKKRSAQWENQYTFRSQELLEEHFEKHGIDMGYEDEASYLAGANRVIASPGVLHKLEKEDGDDVYYLEESNEFVIVSTKGYIRTYFSPEDGLRYYERQ